MRRAALMLVATLLTLSGGAPAAWAGALSAATLEPHHPMIVVTFANTPSQATGRAGTTARRYTGSGYLLAQRAHRQAQRVAEAYSLREVANWPIRALAVHCVVYEVPDDRPLAAILTALAKDPQITLAQPLQQFHTLTQSDTGSAYNDPLYDLQSNLASLDIAAAHEQSRGAGVRVALIDTGVDSAHPDLKGRISGSHSYVGPRPQSPGELRHGTAMAGLISATANNGIGIVGIAPLAQIEVFAACWQLRPDSDEAVCNTFTLAQALAAALDTRIPVVNLSIAGPADPLLASLIEVGLKRGVIFVGAEAAEADSFPTGIAGVIGVGSNEREVGHPTVTAPSVHVLTLHPKGQYDFESGTSVAAAEVTGVVALLLAADSHLMGGDVVSLLRRTAGSAAQAMPADALANVNANAALVAIAAERNRRLASRSSH